MKIFLTGATGFIGSHFLQLCLASGHEVRAIRRLNSRPRINITGNPVWLTGSLDEDFSNHFEDVDVFVHMAAHSANYPYDDLSACIYWNVFSSIKLAQQAIKHGVKKFIVLGSCFEYGMVKSGSVDVQTKLEPMNSYSISKAAASVAFSGLAREKNIFLKILRPFQVYGEGEEESRFWPSLRRAAKHGEDFALSAGGQIRDFIPVADVAEKILIHLDFDSEISGIPFVGHIASGNPMSLKEFAEECWLSFGASGRLLFGKVPYRENELMSLISKP